MNCPVVILIDQEQPSSLNFAKHYQTLLWTRKPYQEMEERGQHSQPFAEAGKQHKLKFLAKKIEIFLAKKAEIQLRNMVPVGITEGMEPFSFAPSMEIS